MFSYSILPSSLLALLFILPTLSAPTTYNDPFHGIAIQVPQTPEQPICCLRPLTPLEPTEDEVLVPFEEWKAKRLADVHSDDPNQTPSSGQRSKKIAHTEPAFDPTPSDTASSLAQGLNFMQSDDAENMNDRSSPHFRIPLTDRFNYASLDCSARVHTAHKSAKSPSSILSSKKDRYMLSPCAEERQFVVVELCEDIRIDTVQLANYEFFSGVFKDFTVSVAKTYTTDESEWTVAGTYRANNTRGVQSFHPPPSLRDFYRFIRIEFQSHYGNEYYCPVSLLRVYGLTHLEHWKWDSWELESRAKRSVEDPIVLVDDTEPPQPAHAHATEYSSDVSNSTAWSNPALQDSPADATTVLPDTSSATSLSHSDAEALANLAPSNTAVQEIPSHEAFPSDAIATPAPHTSVAVTAEEQYTHSFLSLVGLSAHTVSSHSSQSQTLSDSLYIKQSNMTTVSVSPLVSQLPEDHPGVSSEASQNSQSQSNRSSSSGATHSIVPTPSASSLVPISQPITTGGESIYRTIMNRLTALEANTTLYARYVEEQTAGVREILKRLGEDVGRLEGIGRAQAQMYQRSISELEKQRRRIELEHNELMSRVGHLTDEVVLEKRLGIAQLCLMLIVLVFVTLTRGSRSDLVHLDVRTRTSSMRDWGRRTLSGDWFRSRSNSPPSAHATAHATELALGERQSGRSTTNERFGWETKLKFPSQGIQTADGFPKSKRAHPVSGKIGSRPHTPISSLRNPIPRHLHNPYRPVTPTGSLLARIPLQRASSNGSTLAHLVGPVPKLAKRLARTAHLHEVKSSNATMTFRREDLTRIIPRAGRGRNIERVSKDADVFGILDGSDQGLSAMSAPGTKAEFCAAYIPPEYPPKNEHPSTRAYGDSEISETDGWVDTDVDGSSSELNSTTGKETY